MLRSMQGLFGFELHETDGEMGSVDDVYFDDDDWEIRYLVVRTGGWLKKRRVLLAPAAVSRPDWEGRKLHVHLTKEQVKNSPDVTADKPVSRDEAEQLITYYGWPNFLRGGDLADGGLHHTHEPEAVTVTDPLMQEHAPTEEEQGDLNLQSSHDVLGYQAHSEDGEIGYLEDFLVDDEGWQIRYAVVDVEGKYMLVLPEHIGGISCPEKHVYIRQTTERLEKAPTFDPNLELTDEFQEAVKAHYERK